MQPIPLPSLSRPARREHAAVAAAGTGVIGHVVQVDLDRNRPGFLAASMRLPVGLLPDRPGHMRSRGWTTWSVVVGVGARLRRSPTRGLAQPAVQTGCADWSAGQERPAHNASPTAMTGTMGQCLRHSWLPRPTLLGRCAPPALKLQSRCQPLPGPYSTGPGTRAGRPSKAPDPR